MDKQDKPHVDYRKIDRAFDAIFLMDYIMRSLTEEELMEMRWMWKVVREGRKTL